MQSDDEIEALLQRDGAALAAYRALPPSHKREYLSWVGEAKLPATQVRRIEKMIQMLKKK